MEIHFEKYQGTGNDFVMLNNLDGAYDFIKGDLIATICDRKMGVGADGLIKISKSNKADFEVDYYNADGSKSFCGNGARCATQFAHSLGLFDDKAVFDAIDGIHTAKMVDGWIELEMLPVTSLQEMNGVWTMDTGSPHYVAYNINENIVDFGKRIRYSDEFTEKGINVNTVRVLNSNALYVETYERGVEDETLSCGTGVTACALSYMAMNKLEKGTVEIETKGGNLKVQAQANGAGFDNVWLIGPAEFVFKGVYSLD